MTNSDLSLRVVGRCNQLQKAGTLSPLLFHERNSTRKLSSEPSGFPVGDFRNALHSFPGVAHLACSECHACTPPPRLCSSPDRRSVSGSRTSRLHLLPNARHLCDPGSRLPHKLGQELHQADPSCSSGTRSTSCISPECSGGSSKLVRPRVLRKPHSQW